MAHHQSAIKRIRQTKKRNYYNRTHKKAMRMAIREVREATDHAVAVEKFQKATSILDRVAAKGIVHKNFAAHRKSSLAKHVNSLKK